MTEEKEKHSGIISFFLYIIVIIILITLTIYLTNPPGDFSICSNGNISMNAISARARGYC